MKDQSWFYFALILFFVFLSKYIISYFLYSDLAHVDCIGHLPWAYHYADPSFFNNDAIREFWSNQLGTVGSIFVYKFIGPVVDPKWIVIVNQVFCYCLFAWLLLKIGEIYGIKSKLLVGYSLLVIFIFEVEHVFDHMAGGFSRSTGYVIIGLLAYSLKCKNILLIGCTSFLGIVFYPPVFLISFISAFIFVLINKSIRQAFFLGVLHTPSVIILSIFYIDKKSKWGPVASWDNAIKMPEFCTGGILPLIKSGNFFYNSIISSPASSCSVLIMAGFLIYLLAKHRASELKDNTESFCITISGLILFFAGWAVFSNLYEPTRYIRYTFPFLSLIVICKILSKFENFCEFSLVSNKRIAFFYLVTLLIFGAHSVECVLKKEKGVPLGVVSALPLILINKINFSPSDVVFFGNPRDLDQISLFCKRSVYLNTHAFFPYRPGFHEFMYKRLGEYAEVFCVDNLENLVQKVSKIKANLFLLNKRDFDCPRGFSKPSQDYLNRFFVESGCKYFKEMPKIGLVLECGDYLLYDLDQIRLLQCDPEKSG